ncbi:hypothetical protein L7F22_025833 [Adiantum nelumboides]|nr:hypothetical protein [Adiantum nelumboides]
MEKAIVQDENGLKKVEFSSTVGFVEVSKKELSIHFGLEEESIHLHQVFGNTNEGLSFEMPSSRRGEEVMFHLDFQFGKIFIVRGKKVSRGVIHTGHHMHPVAEGVSKQILDDVRERVSKMVSKEVGGGRPRSFQLKLAKEIVMESCLFQDHKGDAELCDKDLSALLVKLAPVIDKRSQEEFKLRCRAWKSAPSEEAAEQELDNLSTWLREGHADKTNTLALQTWLIWWHARVAHWGEYMMKAMQGDERYLIPRSNLAESMHGSWLASTDGVKYISLYSACYNDLVNTLIQHSKYDSYLKGGHIGCGPGLEKLKRRASTSAIPPAPREVIDLTNEAAIELEAANRRVSADGDSRSVRRKREGVLKNPIKDGDSHRPEYEYVTYNTQCHRTHDVLQGVQNEGEVEIHPTRWAIRRTTAGSQVRCQGYVRNERRKCNELIDKKGRAGLLGVLAPCFEGLIETPSGTKKQLVWFCGSNVAHTWEPSHNVIEKPTTRPALWPVALGTSLDSMEIIALLNAGFDLKDISAEAHQQVGGTPFAVDNDIDVRPMHRNGKLVTIVRVVNKEMQDRIKRASELVCTIQRRRIVVPKEHVEYTLSTEGSIKKELHYMVIVSAFPSCTCDNFQNRDHRGKRYMPCKHLYFIYMRELGLNVDHQKFIHQATLTKRELQQALRLVV